MKKLYVGNLPFQATEQDLSSWFEQAGVSGAQVTLIRDQLSGQLRGFGFVEVPNDEEAGRAVEALNGQDFMGRSVVVNEARPKASGESVDVAMQAVAGERARWRSRWRRGP